MTDQGRKAWNEIKALKEMKTCETCYFNKHGENDYCSYFNKKLIKPAINEHCSYGEMEETWKRHKEAHENAYKEWGKEEYLSYFGEYNYHRYILEDHPIESDYDTL
jgi:hypothetical protein